jgi:hypothetical protein
MTQVSEPISELIYELKSLHLFISKSILLTNNVFMLNLDMTKNSYYTLKKVCDYNTAPLYGSIKIYNPNNINLNNSEIMSTLNYSPKYNNFIIKSVTVIDKVYKHNNSYNKSFNKRIINNIMNIPL